jgi:uncharacterized protein YkuJ
MFQTLITDSAGDEKRSRDFEEKGFVVTKMDYEVQFPEKERTFVFTVAGKHSSPIRQVIETLSGLSFVRRLEIKS